MPVDSANLYLPDLVMVHGCTNFYTFQQCALTWNLNSVQRSYTCHCSKAELHDLWPKYPTSHVFTSCMRRFYDRRNVITRVRVFGHVFRQWRIGHYVTTTLQYFCFWSRIFDSEYLNDQSSVDTWKTMGTILATHRLLSRVTTDNCTLHGWAQIQ